MPRQAGVYTRALRGKLNLVLKRQKAGFRRQPLIMLHHTFHVVQNTSIAYAVVPEAGGNSLKVSTITKCAPSRERRSPNLIGVIELPIGMYMSCSDLSS